MLSRRPRWRGPQQLLQLHVLVYVQVTLDGFADQIRVAAWPTLRASIGQVAPPPAYAYAAPVRWARLDVTKLVPRPERRCVEWLLVGRVQDGVAEALVEPLRHKRFGGRQVIERLGSKADVALVQESRSDVYAVVEHQPELPRLREQAPLA